MAKRKIRPWNLAIPLVREGLCFGLAAAAAGSSSFADEFEWIEVMASSIVHHCFGYFASLRRRHRNYLSSRLDSGENPFSCLTFQNVRVV